MNAVRRLVITTAATVLVSLSAPPARAQTDCAQALRDADSAYRAGRPEEARQVEAACLRKGVPLDEQVQARALLAKVHLAEDETEEAAAAVRALVELDPGYSASPTDPPRFRRLLADEQRRRRATARVAGVSKVDEPLREAPATVAVVTAEEIERRGYQDLEELLHDLPGFDISRGNGDVYSNIYMRGYRSDRSDRLLFLVDGVEQNDLHSNTAHISRQVPLSNVERVEVVYGPASTIYGANAFNGVISVTTRAPAALLEEGESFSVDATVGGGSFSTRYVDATFAGRTRSGRLSWSLTGRAFHSDERDLAGFDDWDNDPSGLDEIDYFESLRLTGQAAADLADVCEILPDDCRIVEDDGGGVVALEPTETLIARARELDRQLFELLGDRAADFSDETDDWAIDGKVQVGDNFTFGLQTWRRQEGTSPWYTDLFRAGGAGNAWTPKQTNLWARFSHPIGNRLELSLFSRFKQHELDGDSSIDRLVTAATGAFTLVDLAGFLFEPFFQTITFDQRSTQFRNEVTLTYQPSDRFNLVGGVELRDSSVQLELTSSVTEQIPENGPYTFPFFLTQIGSSKRDGTDVGVYVQASFKPRDDFKIVAGGRVDVNRVQGDQAFLTFDLLPFGSSSSDPCPLSSACQAFSIDLGGDDTVFNPRLALVYTRGDFVAKAIYAEAFKEPSSFQNFTREPGLRDFPSAADPNGLSAVQLESEEVENLELNVSWQPREDFFVELTAYDASYSNAVALTRQVSPDPFFVFPAVGGRFRNIGALEIRGAHIQARGGFANFELFGNYTYTDPSVDPVDDETNPFPDADPRRVGDIASHQLNLGVDLALGERLDLDLRTNWVGDRETGSSTSVIDNPFDEIDAYFVAHATLSYRWPPAGGRWQLVVRNLFDTDYFHPGVQRGGAGFASRLPQPGRAVYLRYIVKR